MPVGQGKAPFVSEIALHFFTVFVEKFLIEQEQFGHLAFGGFPSIRPVSAELKLSGSEHRVARASGSVRGEGSILPQPSLGIATRFFVRAHKHVPLRIGICTVVDPTLGVPTADTIATKTKYPIARARGYNTLAIPPRVSGDCKDGIAIACE